MQERVPGAVRTLVALDQIAPPTDGDRVERIYAQCGEEALRHEVAELQVNARSRLARLDGQGDLAQRIDIRESLVEEYAIDRDFGIVVAKDVLHYLAEPDVESVLESAVANARSMNYHYLEVFTSITRRSAEGRLRQIEGEAGYSPESFQRLIERVYSGWDVTLLWDEHAEIDSRTGANCFEAVRATVIAENTSA